MAAGRGQKEKHSKVDLVEWFTVSYRTLYIVAGVALAVGAAGAFWYYYRHGATTPIVAETASTATAAKFVTIEGSVQMKSAGSLRWESANKTMPLNKADLVRTGSGSSAEIKFFNDAVFRVRPDSVFIIEETSEDPSSKQRRAAVKIQSGEVNFQVPERDVRGSATTISTPTVKTTAADEAEGNVNVAGGGATSFRVFRGRIDGQTTGGDRVALAANEGLRVDAQGRAGPKVTLPGVPVLTAPPPQADIAYPSPAEATTLLAWKAVPGAVAYHVLVDMTGTFNRPVVDRKEWKALSMELRGLDVGSHFWQVAAIDKDGTRGSFSLPSRFVVSQGGSAPPALTLEPLAPRGNTVQVKGRTEAGAAVSVNGEKVDVRPDGSFNEFLTLASGRQEVVVRATGANGGIAELRRPVVAPD
jgi:FecR protein/Glucodextranase, domain B